MASDAVEANRVAVGHVGQDMGPAELAGAVGPAGWEPHLSAVAVAAQLQGDGGADGADGVDVIGLMAEQQVGVG